MIIKQYFTDGLIQLAIILSILRTDVTNYFTRNYIRYPEVQEMVLGNSLIYTQTDFHRNVINSIDSVQLHPKALRDNDRYISSIFQDIRELGQYARYSADINTDIHAFLVGQDASVAYQAAPSAEYLPPVSHIAETGDVTSSNDTSSLENVSEGLQYDVASVHVEGAASMESPPPPPLSAEPTKEDLDLIEVLWRQDIDLGVGREVFDPALRRELEQERELELQKQRQKQHELDVLQYKLEQEKRQVAHQWLNQHYVQDGETGEWMPVPNPSPEQVASPSASTDHQEEEPLSYDEAWRILDGVATDIPLDELDEYVNPRHTLPLDDMSPYVAPVQPESAMFVEPELIQTGEGALSLTPDPLDRLIQTGEGALNRLIQTNEAGLGTFIQTTGDPFTPSPLMVDNMSQMERTVQLESTYEQGGSLEAQSSYSRQTSFEQNWQDLVSLLHLPNNTSTSTTMAETMDITADPVTLMMQLAADTADTLLPNSTLQLSDTSDALLQNATLPPMIGIENSTGLSPMISIENSTGLSPPGNTRSSFASATDLNNNHTLTAFSHNSTFMPISGDLSPSNNDVAINDTLGQPVTLSWNPTDVMFPELNSPSNISDNVNMSEVKHLLQDFLPDADFEGITLDDMQLSDDLESLQMVDEASRDSAGSRASASSHDSAISSLGGSSPHSQDQTDAFPPADIPQSNSTSLTPLITLPQNMADSTSLTLLSSAPFDGLEGATGGSDLPSDSKLGKYEPEDYSYSYSQYSGVQNRSDMNYSSSSNDTSFDDSKNADNELCPVQHNHTYPAQPGTEPRDLRTKATKTERLSAGEKKALSRDHRRALELKLPFTVEQVINTPVEEFNEMLARYKLNEPQLQLVRDIRRRGKNKVAAQNCRKRKFDVIYSLSDEMDNMLKERERLQRQRRLLDKETREVKERYNQLYEDVLQSLRDDNGHPYDPDAYSLQLTTDGNVFLVPRNDSAVVSMSHSRPSMNDSGTSMSSSGQSMGSSRSASTSSSSSGASSSSADDTPQRTSNRKRKHDKYDS